MYTVLNYHWTGIHERNRRLAGTKQHTERRSTWAEYRCKKREDVDEKAIDDGEAN